MAVGHFPEHVWLAPEPRARWLELIGATCARFPGTPPYEGLFDEPEPHLTIGEQTADHPTEEILATAERELVPALPLRFRVESVTLLEEQADATWSVARSFPLG